MSNVSLDATWAATFPNRSRPQAYASSVVGDDGYYPLTDTDEFLVQSLQNLTPAQLFTLAANNAEALRVVQQEWTELERLAQHIKSRDPLPVTYKDPQQLPSYDIFEERKEANIYNYKYDSNRRMLPARFTLSENVTDQEKFDCREPPEPFNQGGFIPTEKQFKLLMATARNEGRERNPDNQKPYVENFAFKSRPAGVWIAKVMPPEAPPPPRTRAREAQLNGTADRQTRFNGEKVPLTRQLSSTTTDAPSPGKRTATPTEGASPASKKRRIDTVDITSTLLKKKHPNQYTKRREAEVAARIASEQAGIAGNEPSPMQISVELPATEPVKKKHPNQYTKRREREEAERFARERNEAAQAGVMAPFESHQGYLRAVGHQPSYQGGHYKPSPAPYAPSHMYDIPATHERPPHSNQYVNQRDQDRISALEASYQARFASPASSSTQGHLNLHTKRVGMGESERYDALYNTNPAAMYPNWQAQQLPYSSPNYIQHQFSRSATPNKQPTTTSVSSKKKDPLTMTKEELRTHLFKDHELIAFLQQDHSWLNDDADLATTWKNRILNSAYPVRTWAMLRKWKEWKADGKDKRPRDKDGSKPREYSTTSGTKAVTGRRVGDVVREIRLTDADAAAEVDVESAGVNEELVTVTSGIGQARSSPARRPIRLRTRLDTAYLGSPGLQPSSPLVNGINARDLDLESPSSIQAKSFFSSKLQTMGELDSNTKVDTWQTKNEAQTDYVVSTLPGKGVLRQHPRTRRPQEADDEFYPSSGEVDYVPSNAKRETGQDAAESEDPLHGSSPSSFSDTSSSATLHDAESEDKTYRDPNRRTKMTFNANTNATNNGDLLRRTRATRRSSQAQISQQKYKSAASTQDESRDRSSPRIPTNDNTATSRAAERERERHPSPTGNSARRSGLRPNPPKRTVTNESLGSMVGGGKGPAGTLPTRRSMRNPDKEREKIIDSSSSGGGGVGVETRSGRRTSVSS